MRRTAAPTFELSSSLVLALLLSGCAVFSDLPPSAPRNHDEPVVERLRVFLDSETDPNEHSGQWNPFPVVAHEKTALETLRSSGWVGELDVATDPAAADLTLRVERYQRWSPTGALTAITLGLFPSRWQWSLKVKLVRQYPDRVPQTCVQIHHHSEWMQLFLLPFMITRSPGPYEQDAVARLTARCSAEIFGPRSRG